MPFCILKYVCCECNYLLACRGAFVCIFCGHNLEAKFRKSISKCLIDNIKENVARWLFWISHHESKMMIVPLSSSLSPCTYIKWIMSLHITFYVKINYPYLKQLTSSEAKINGRISLLTIISYHTAYVMLHIALVYYCTSIISFSVIFNLINPHWWNFNQWICSMDNYRH